MCHRAVTVDVSAGHPLVCFGVGRLDRSDRCNADKGQKLEARWYMRFHAHLTFSEGQCSTVQLIWALLPIIHDECYTPAKLMAIRQ